MPIDKNTSIDVFLIYTNEKEEFYEKWKRVC